MPKAKQTRAKRRDEDDVPILELVRADMAKKAKGETQPDDDDDVPILELVRRGDYVDAKWRAPGRGKVLEIHKIVDWKIDAPLSHESRESHDHRSIFFLVWWKGYALSESTWEPASGIHPVEQVRFFKAAGVFD